MLVMWNHSYFVREGAHRVRFLAQESWKGLEPFKYKDQFALIHGLKLSG